MILQQKEFNFLLGEREPSERRSLNLLSRAISTRENLNKIIYYSGRKFEITRGSNVKFGILERNSF